jgi:hypothetical protein
VCQPHGGAAAAVESVSRLHAGLRVRAHEATRLREPLELGERAHARPHAPIHLELQLEPICIRPPHHARAQPVGRPRDLLGVVRTGLADRGAGGTDQQPLSGRDGTGLEWTEEELGPFPQRLGRCSRGER